MLSTRAKLNRFLVKASHPAGCDSILGFKILEIELAASVYGPMVKNGTCGIVVDSVVLPMRGKYVKVLFDGHVCFYHVHNLEFYSSMGWVRQTS